MSQDPSESERGDLVDRIQAEWAQAYPQYDVAPIAVLGRIQRVASVASQRLDRQLEQHGVTRSEFDVLGALARAGRPLRASEVVSTTTLSGASITKLTEALVRRGLVRRGRSPVDGRVVLLEVTDAGRGVVDQELPRRLADDEAVLAGLSPRERETLVVLLRRVARSLEDSPRP
ncbi:MarR family winged helix-turn-helix transcriptional regulator [Gordonia sp. (in: high G+C Gram-positive bacteria)]|uniref:MarR family winged helix-turn-helix transcriptional regulator n=1 Tax=unclassified Gordonia (in: high G+C Gram-positive bacteria) TaxID=2657482 RepID=UPI002617D76D|nr:MarR family transcriptional regulator [Gordonia sp. (in: high G+C Gram-positive bacteria)]